MKFEALQENKIIKFNKNFRDLKYKVKGEDVEPKSLEKYFKMKQTRREKDFLYWEKQYFATLSKVVKNYDASEFFFALNPLKDLFNFPKLKQMQENFTESLNKIINLPDYQRASQIVLQLLKVTAGTDKRLAKSVFSVKFLDENLEEAEEYIKNLKKFEEINNSMLVELVKRGVNLEEIYFTINSCKTLSKRVRDLCSEKIEELAPLSPYHKFYDNALKLLEKLKKDERTSIIEENKAIYNAFDEEMIYDYIFFKEKLLKAQKRNITNEEFDSKMKLVESAYAHLNEVKLMFDAE